MVFGIFFNDHVFSQNFGKRLKCNTDCQKMVNGSNARSLCEAENCIEIKTPDDPEAIEDEYDYSYGADDDSSNNVVTTNDNNAT
jgi:hypothetical protein